MQALAVDLATRLLLVQQEPGFDVDVTLGQGLAGGAVGAFLTTFVVGAIALAVFPERTEELMDAVVDDPVGSFAYGVLSLVALVAATILLVFTIIGILVALPLVLVAYVFWAAGSAVAFLAIADRLIGGDEDDTDEDWLLTLFVAALLSGGLAATGVGAVLGLAVGAAGFGAILRPHLE